MKVNTFTKEPMRHMTMHQPLHLNALVAMINELLLPGRLGSFIMGELTVLTASTLIRMYGSLPREWLIISVCRSEISGGEHPGRTEKDTEKLAGAWSYVVSNQQRTARECWNMAPIMIDELGLMNALHRIFLFIENIFQYNCPLSTLLSPF